MNKRVLGKTNFEVSAVGIGGIPIQRVDQEMATAILRKALEEGLNFIDTARGYRSSEERIGLALEELGRDQFILATKSMDRTYEGVTRDFFTSLELLRTDYIDLYQFHNVKTKAEYQMVLAENGALTAARELQAKGLIREIGISSHSADVLNIAIESGEFATIQFPYNAVERQGEALFQKAKEKNIGVIIMKPLGGGALSNGEAAIRFVLENPNVSVVIPGMDSVDQVHENARAGREMRPLTEEERFTLETEAQALGKEFCRRCGYCAPCTVGIDIPGNFVVDSYYTRYNLKDWAEARYHAMDINAKDCIECGECQTRCPYNLPIIDMLKKVASHY